MWIRVETNVADNDKIHCFGNFLGISVEETLGFLVRTWGKVAEQRTDGDLEGVLDSTLESWAGWNKESGLFASGFREHFVNGYQITGWKDRQGKLIARQQADRERKKTDGISTEVPRKVQGKSIPTIRYDTKLTDMFDEQFWPAYPRRSGGEGKAEARKAFVTRVTTDKIPAELLISKAGEYRSWCEAAKTEPKFIKMATTWLRTSRGWEEDWSSNKRQQQDMPLLNAATK